MIVYSEIINGRKSYRSRKNHKTKISFQKDGFYECIGLYRWARYDVFQFRLEEIYYFLGGRVLFYDANTLEEKPFREIISIMIPLVTIDFEQILIEAQMFYNSKENFMQYYRWVCGRR